jgi:hypothetical protein
MRRIPFTRIGGTSILKPPVLARAQTDGSYHSAYKMSRTAVILHTPEKFMMIRSYLDGEHKNSTESEWASIYDGVVFSNTQGQGSLELENDNLGIIRCLQEGKAAKGLEFDYLYEIMRIADDMEWLGVRWIPREQNRADQLFRKGISVAQPIPSS